VLTWWLAEDASHEAKKRRTLRDSDKAGTLARIWRDGAGSAIMDGRGRVGLKISLKGSDIGSTIAPRL
jgi:hypothetical protein